MNRIKQYCKFGHDTRIVGRHKSGGCKACSRKQTRQWQIDNPEKSKENDRLYAKKHRTQVTEAHRNWSHRNPEKIKEYDLKELYDISLKEYNQLLRSQNGQCAICLTCNFGKNFGKTLKYFNVDHDHKTKVVRGLLCSNCNTMLGLAKDSTELLSKAITYLKRNSL